MSPYDSRSRTLARERYWDEHDKDSYQCPDCGRSRDEVIGEFQVHHKGGNPYDNRIDEIVGLCGYCHRLREGKKPSLQRLRKMRDNDSMPVEPHVHDFVKSFIDKRLCLCSEGRNYPWTDAIEVHYGVLDNHLQNWGYEINDKFRTELIAAYRLLPETRIEWDEYETHMISIIIGPDPHGRRNCDCLSRTDLSRQNRELGEWR